MKYSVFQQTCKEYFRKMNYVVKPQVVAQGLKFHRKPNYHECTFEFYGIRMYVRVDSQNKWSLTHYDNQKNPIVNNGSSIDEACSVLFRNGGK